MEKRSYCGHPMSNLDLGVFQFILTNTYPSVFIMVLTNNTAAPNRGLKIAGGVYEVFFSSYFREGDVVEQLDQVFLFFSSFWFIHRISTEIDNCILD